MTDDDAMMAAFRRDYLGLLGPRVARIEAQVRSGDAINARVAMLSLETSSAMAGAGGLAAVVRSLRVAVDQGERTAAEGLLDALLDEAQRVGARVR